MKSHGNSHEVPRTRVFGLGIVALAALWLACIAASWAEAAEGEPAAPAAAEPSEDEEYNFSWLDPDKKIYVLQNRKYLKRGRGMISVMGGPGSSNAYRNTAGIGGRLGYFFSEWLGLEAFYTHVVNTENNTFEQLRRATSNIVPVVREIRGQSGILLNFVPWYAKINVFNSILYFDWYFNVGVGGVNTRLDLRTNAAIASSYISQNFTALYAGTGHLFHLSDLWVARIDASGAFYQAPEFGNAGDDTWFSNYLFGFGLGLKL